MLLIGAEIGFVRDPRQVVVGQVGPLHAAVLAERDVAENMLSYRLTVSRLWTSPARLGKAIGAPMRSR